MRLASIVFAGLAGILLLVRLSGGAEPSEDALRAAGIQRLESKFLTLYTDVRNTPAVDELPQVFDLAVPQWCAYFGVPETRAAGWRMTACIMQEVEPFQRLQLMPTDLPPFLTGYQQGERLWMYEQPSDYYRRHLLLHEGTHGFTASLFGGSGPPWYMEGIAEYLGLHRWQEGKLTLGYNPRDNDEVPYWGRVKILKQEYAAGRKLSLIEVMKYDSKAHLRIEPYAWCWAAALFLEQHPDYQTAFRACRQDLADSSLEFSRKLYRRLEGRWPEVELNWQAFIANMEYGYDVRQAAVTFSNGTRAELPADGLRLEIAANRGWQSTGLRVAAEDRLLLTAQGRYQLAMDPLISAEPGGITLHYYQGRPWGQLLAAVVPDQQPERIGEVFPIGLSAELQPPVAGVLYLKINESGADLGDNAGKLEVRVVRK